MSARLNNAASFAGYIPLRRCLALIASRFGDYFSCYRFKTLQGDIEKRELGPSFMTCQILFCLSSADTGTVRNPALMPIVDAAGQILEFSSLDDAYSVLIRLRRLAAGLSYYVTSIPTEHSSPAPVRTASSSLMLA